MKKYPTTSGRAVPRDKTNRKEDVSPGKAKWAIEENRNADNPKPDKTIPVVEARSLSGKDFAVEFTAPDNAEFPPAPVMKPNSASMQSVNVVIVDWSSFNPAS